MELVKNEKKYVRRLDLIRVISCVMVFLYHLNILKGGFLAVCTFFVLSGYLTCASALNKSKFSIKEYYKKRFVKIYIPLIVVIALSVISIKCIKNIRWINLKQETISALLGYNNFWQLKANLDYFTRHINSPFMHLWYISILIQFDLVFPIIYLILKKIEIKYKNNISLWIVTLGTIISTIVFFYMSKTQDIMVVYYNTFTRIFSIFYGVLLAIILNKYNFKLPKKLINNSKMIFRLYLIVLILLGIFVSSEAKNYSIFMIITSLISVRLIRYSYFEKKKKRATSKDRIITFIASFTYEIYLVQYPVIFLMQNKCNNVILKNIIITVITFVISYLIHILINNRFSNKFYNILKKLFIRINNNYRSNYYC